MTGFFQIEILLSALGFPAGVLRLHLSAVRSISRRSSSRTKCFSAKPCFCISFDLLRLFVKPFQLFSCTCFYSGFPKPKFLPAWTLFNSTFRRTQANFFLLTEPLKTNPFWFKLRLFCCANPRVGMKRSKFQLSSFFRLHIFGAVFYRSSDISNLL